MKLTINFSPSIIWMPRLQNLMEEMPISSSISFQVTFARRCSHLHIYNFNARLNNLTTPRQHPPGARHTHPRGLRSRAPLTIACTHQPQTKPKTTALVFQKHSSERGQSHPCTPDQITPRTQRHVKGKAPKKGTTLADRPGRKEASIAVCLHTTPLLAARPIFNSVKSTNGTTHKASPGTQSLPAHSAAGGSTWKR